MERLTKRLQELNGLCIAECEKECTESYYECHKCKPFADVMKKLADYEDAEEQGLLLRLPCKVDDMVWDIGCGKPYAYKITGYSFGTAEDYIDEPYKEDEIMYYCADGSITGSFASSEIGKTVFLTKEEAERALAEMKGV